MTGGYHPSNEVKTAHGIPHLTTEFHATDPSFPKSFGDIVAYLTTLAPFPALILGVALILLLGYAFTACCACFCRLLKCCSCCFKFSLRPLNYDDPFDKLNPDAIYRLNYHRNILRVFVLLLLTLLIIVQFLWLVDSQFKTAFHDFTDGIEALKNLIDRLSKAMSKISDDGTLFEGITKSCFPSNSPANSVISTMTKLAQSVASVGDSVSSALNPVSDELKNVISIVNGQVIPYVEYVVGGFYGAIFLIFIIYAIVAKCQTYCGFRFAIMLTWIISLLLFLISAVETVLVMFLSDFCFDPTGNLLRLANVGNSTALTFYLTCDGASPIGDKAASVLNITTELSNLINVANITMATPGCTRTSIFAPIVDMAKQISGEVIQPLTKCNEINTVYTNIVLDSLCTHGFSGLYNMWLIQFVVAVLLYCIMCFGDAVYHTYVIILRDGNLSLLSFMNLNEINAENPNFHPVKGSIIPGWWGQAPVAPYIDHGDHDGIEMGSMEPMAEAYPIPHDNADPKHHISDDKRHNEHEHDHHQHHETAGGHHHGGDHHGAHDSGGHIDKHHEPVDNHQHHQHHPHNHHAGGYAPVPGDPVVHVNKPGDF